MKEVCPSCGKNENKIEVCKHCSFEYNEEPITFLEKLIAIIFLILFIWLILTLMYWFFINFNDKSLFEIFKNQWNHIINLKII